MEEVLICAIAYRVTRPDEWTVLFTERTPMGEHRQMMFHRPKFGLWTFYPESAEQFPCAHIVAAYEWIRARVADEHEDRTNDGSQPFVSHQWNFDLSKMMNVCGKCGNVMSVQTKYRSCESGFVNT